MFISTFISVPHFLILHFPPLNYWSHIFRSCTDISFIRFWSFIFRSCIFSQRGMCICHQAVQSATGLWRWCSVAEKITVVFHPATHTSRPMLQVMYIGNQFCGVPRVPIFPQFNRYHNDNTTLPSCCGAVVVFSLCCCCCLATEEFNSAYFLRYETEFKEMLKETWLFPGSLKMYRPTSQLIQ